MRSKTFTDLIVCRLLEERFWYEEAGTEVARFWSEVPLPGADNPEISEGSLDCTVGKDKGTDWDLSDVNAGDYLSGNTVLKSKLNEFPDPCCNAKVAKPSTAVDAVDLGRAHVANPSPGDTTIRRPLQPSAIVLLFQADYSRFVSELSQLKQERSVLQSLANGSLDELVQVHCQLWNSKSEVCSFQWEIRKQQRKKEFIANEPKASSEN